MSEEKEGVPLTELSPREFAKSLFTKERFQQIDEQIINILTPDFGDNLMRVPKKGERKNWQALQALTSIVFGKEIKAPSAGKDKSKPYKYKVDIDVQNEDGTIKTMELNARMVGQILQQLMAHAEVTSKYKGKKSELELEQDAREAAIDHTHQAVKKYNFSQQTLENSNDELTNRRTLQQQLGIVAFPGIDKASPEQILHILKSIEQTAKRSTPADIQRRNDNLSMGISIDSKLITAIPLSRNN